MEQVTITATFDLSDESCKWRNPDETTDGFRRIIEEELAEYNIDNVKVVSKHETIIDNNKQPECAHYKLEGGAYRCWGTKESELCSCNGYKQLCDFYIFDDNGMYKGLK